MSEEAYDIRDYVPQPINGADILREQVPGNPDPRPGPATGDQPYDNR